MRIIFSVFLFFILESCDSTEKNNEYDVLSVENQYYDYVLDDFRVGSSFVVLPIKKSKNHLIIPNADFFYFLKKNQKITKIDYQREIKKILVNRDSLELTIEECKYLNFFIISDSTLNRDKKNIQQIITENPNCIQMNTINQKKLNAFVFFLTKKGYLAHISDISGNLVYKKFNYAKSGKVILLK